MPINDDSILDSIKKVRGISPQDSSFDEDIMMAINSAFSTLHQLGVGPTTPFYIEGKEPKWSAFIGDVQNIQLVKSYVARFVKLEFDPPSTSFALTAAKEKLQEDGWRLMEACDHSRPLSDSADITTLVTPDP